MNSLDIEKWEVSLVLHENGNSVEYGLPDGPTRTKSFEDSNAATEFFDSVKALIKQANL